MRISKLISLALFCLLVIGCLPNQHRFQTGKLLKQGKSRVTWGYGRTFNKQKDFVKTWSLGYKLGVTNDWFFFKGVEIGWQLETYNNNGNSAFNTSFEANFKLPSDKFHHSIGMGWIIGGTFIDNTYYLQYAISKEFLYKHLFFLNTSLNFIHTNFEDISNTNSTQIFSKSPFEFRSIQDRFIAQISSGLYFSIPDKFFLAPSVFIPQINYSFPRIKKVTDASYFSFAFGLSWSF